MLKQIKNFFTFNRTPTEDTYEEYVADSTWQYSGASPFGTENDLHSTATILERKEGNLCEWVKYKRHHQNASVDHMSLANFAAMFACPHKISK